MARPGLALLDWHLFSKAVRVGGSPAIWSRFPVELAPDLIVCPHLFDWPLEASREHEAYTCAGIPLCMVFCGRGSHLRFLRDELIPATIRHARHLMLVDGDNLRFVSTQPADARAAFMPQSRVDGDGALPSMIGALMAGGDNGKTELMHGRTWSTVITEGPDVAGALAQKLQREIAQWTSAAVTVTPPSFELPDEPDDHWFITAWKRYVTIHVPFHREGCLPWHVQAGG